METLLNILYWGMKRSFRNTKGCRTVNWCLFRSQVLWNWVSSHPNYIWVKAVVKDNCQLAKIHLRINRGRKV